MASLPAPKKRTKRRKNHPNTSRAERDEVLVDVEAGDPIVPKNSRYTESSSLAVHTGAELGQYQAADDLMDRDIEGNLDVDLAELSLGQRLTAIDGPDAMKRTSSSDTDEEGDTGASSQRRKKQQETPNVVPANSLTRTLIQALHSSDSRLLETCFAHSDSVLIRNTVRRLPPQLAVPLLSACVERLGRGPRAANMKGGVGGASSQRGTGLIIWVKTVLAVHTAHLMTMPDLVARLAGLHATLSSRLALQDSLLALNGRLDMVLSQIEMRSSAAPASLRIQKGKAAPSSRSKREPTQYIEGESEDEEDVVDADVPIEVDDEEGSIEDVELGSESQDDEEVEEGSEEEEEEDDEDDEGPTTNGFIDDEAEEDDEEEDDEESE